MPASIGRRGDCGSDAGADERAHAAVGAGANRLHATTSQRAQICGRGVYFAERKFLAANVCEAVSEIA